MVLVCPSSQAYYYCLW